MTSPYSIMYFNYIHPFCVSLSSVPSTRRLPLEHSLEDLRPVLPLLVLEDEAFQNSYWNVASEKSHLTETHFLTGFAFV